MKFYFIRAEDDIRDIGVTGVQTCALPIPAVELDAAAPVARGGEAVGRRADEVALDDVVGRARGVRAGVGEPDARAAVGRDDVARAGRGAADEVAGGVVDLDARHPVRRARLRAAVLQQADVVRSEEHTSEL